MESLQQALPHIEKRPPRWTEPPPPLQNEQKPRRYVRDPFNRSTDSTAGIQRMKRHPQAATVESVLRSSTRPSGAARSHAEQRIEQRRKQCSGHRNQSGMKPETPVASRTRRSTTRPHEPESLDGVNSQKKQCEEKNSGKNQAILR